MSIPIKLPPLPRLVDGLDFGGALDIGAEMQAYATAAVLADREALLAKLVHLQGDGPFTKADVEAICTLAVAAALKYGKPK